MRLCWGLLPTSWWRSPAAGLETLRGVLKLENVPREQSDKRRVNLPVVDL